MELVHAQPKLFDTKNAGVESLKLSKSDSDSGHAGFSCSIKYVCHVARETQKNATGVRFIGFVVRNSYVKCDVAFLKRL